MKHYILKSLLTCLYFAPIITSCFPQNTADLPIGFSIVREDSAQDLEIIRRYFHHESVNMIMIASGGCTAAQLVAQAPLHQLTIVDPNKAQLELTKFKINLLMLPTQKRLEILGYAPMDMQDRKEIMLGFMKALDIDPTIFGDIDSIATNGLDFVGKYEQVFQELRNHLSPYSLDLEQAFQSNTLQEQERYLSTDSQLTTAISKALDRVMSQDNLTTVFGNKATANRIQDFSKHFAQRIATYASTFLVSSSPWMANMLLGHFHNNEMFPWLTTTINNSLPSITYIHDVMNNALEQSPSESYHVVHLSNIIDWLTPQEAEKTLDLAYKALKPGGIVIIRQLNSNIDIMNLGKNFNWDTKTSQEFLTSDRSFFYRNFLIGVKPCPSTAPLTQKLADQILLETPVIKGDFFTNLSTMSLQDFKSVQTQFYFAVDYFSRPMAALIARLPLHKDRIDIIHNIIEEHGDFSVTQYHSNTFKQFLRTIGVNAESLDIQPTAPVHMFNTTLMGICTTGDPITAIACLGIIEYAFADISALIAQNVIARNWVSKEDLVHYNLHADIDKQHAQDFFKIIEHHINTQEQDKVIAGLRLGAYIFDRLYQDLYHFAKSNQ